MTDMAAMVAKVKGAIGVGAGKVQQWANEGSQPCPVPQTMPAAPPPIASSGSAAAVAQKPVPPVISPPPVIRRISSPSPSPQAASCGVPPRINAQPGLAASPSPRVVSFNGVTITDDQVRGVELIAGKQFSTGAYWYDKVSGLWGRQGGRPQGRLQPGLELGGPLRQDASGGGTSVFINGRCLGWWELLRIRGFTTFPAGRYWLDASDNFGMEGQPTPMGNLRVLAAQANRAVMYSIAASAIANMASGAGQGGRSAFGHGKNFTTRDLCDCNVVGPNSSE